jgi:hydrogenase maturation protein HypF
MAVAHLMSAGLPTARVGREGRATLEAMVRQGINVVPTSSAGRLFDAVASLLGVRDVTTYEGQAAIELEALSAPEAEDAYALPVVETEAALELDPRPLVAAVVADLERGESVSAIGGRVHVALADAIARTCDRIRARAGLGTVALSGGCFQSRLLTTLAAERLESLGFEVLLHSRVPPNDGGIALGQAAVAAWHARGQSS